MDNHGFQEYPETRRRTSAGTENSAPRFQKCRPSIAAPMRAAKKMSIISFKKRHSIQIALRATIGLPSAVGLIFSNIIGSGIFTSPQVVLKGSGSVALSLVVWFLCGLLTLLGTLTYAELGTLIPDSGGTYIYLLEGFSPNRHNAKKAQWKTLPAFLYNWQSTFFAKPAAMAIIALSCGEYLVRLANSSQCSLILPSDSTKGAVKLIAACILCSVAAINFYSVKLSTRFQNVFATLKLATILLVIALGISSFKYSKAIPLDFDEANLEYGKIALAFYSGLWAFNGWQNLNDVTKEMKNPVRDFPRASIPANLFVIICYLLVNTSFLLVLNKQDLLDSEAVAVGFAYQAAGRWGEIVMIIFVALTMFGSAASGCFSAGRLSFVAAREGHMMTVLSFIHKDYLTPACAIAFNCFLSLLMILPTDIESLISLNGFTTWLFIGTSQICLLIMRKTKIAEERPFKVNIIIPIVVLLFCAFLVITPILDNPTVGYFYILTFLLIGVLVFILFVRLRISVPGANKFTRLLQQLLFILPPHDHSKDNTRL